MKFNFSAAAFALLLGSTATEAAWIRIRAYNGPPRRDTTVHIGNDNRELAVGFLLDGCRNNIGGIKTICIDDRRARAHVDYHSGIKRCFRRTKSTQGNCDDWCWQWDYTQVNCDW
jgi:hypothetical protein